MEKRLLQRTHHLFYHRRMSYGAWSVFERMR